ncbi:MAG: Sensor histidine kinase, partial [Bacteroidota bacterium]|nr:Sensor histidine kinase [Bacteroidota bacterium]
DTSIINWNRGAETIFGFSAKDMIGARLSDIIPDNRKSELEHIINRIIKENAQILSYETSFIQKKGKQIFLLLSISPIKDESGKIFGISTIGRDISESKKMQEALRESELFNKTIISSVGEGIFVADKDKKIRVWNKTMKELTGLNAGEVVGKKVSEIFPDAFRNGMDKACNNALNGETVYTDDTFFKIPKTGNEGWITGSYSPHISASGEIIGVVSTIRDITRKRIADDALKTSEARYKGLFENMSNGVVVYEAINHAKDFILKDCNIAAELIENLDRNESIGKKLSEIIEKHNNSEFFETLLRVWRSGKPESCQFNLKKDSSKPGRRDNYIYKLPTGELVSLFTDVTERYQAENALKESEERYRSFVQNFRGIAFRRKLNFEPIFFHGSVEDITGYNVIEFSSGNLKWNDIINKSDYVSLIEQYDKLSKLPGYEYNLEYRIVRSDTQIRWVQEHLQNISSDSGEFQFFQGTIYNITERREAEEALRRSREQLRNFALYVESAREEERKHIAFEVHDELGHLLTALKLDLSWLLNKRYIKQEVLVEKIQEMSKHIDTIIRKVRSISSQLRPSVLDHFGLIAAIEWQAAEFQKRTAIRCRLSVPSNEITVDERRSTVVFRIFQEILTNVTRHAQATRVDVTFEQQGQELMLRVADNGRGIAQEQVNSKKSFGLIGLHEKASFMGGRVTINGIIGFGTTITLYIPIKQKDTFND